MFVTRLLHAKKLCWEFNPSASLTVDFRLFLSLGCRCHYVTIFWCLPPTTSAHEKLGIELADDSFGFLNGLQNEVSQYVCTLLNEFLRCEVIMLA